MAISVEDIRNKEFASEMRGYNRDEVDDFLDELADQTEELAKANMSAAAELEAAKTEIESLRQQLAAKEAAKSAPAEEKKETAPVVVEQPSVPTFNEPSYFKNLETTLRETLISAQRIADETIDDARKKARRIVADAEEQAAALEEQSQQKLAETRADYENIKNAGEEYHRSFTKLIEEQVKLLKDSPLFTAE